MKPADWIGNGNSIYKTLGASNHTENEREPNDYYATEPKAAELLCEVESLSPAIWECACGEGHLAEVFRKRGHIVKATDLIDRGYGCGGVDFLEENVHFHGDIVTNPPYKYAKEFVEHAIDTVADGCKVCMFLKLQFLEGKARRALFEKFPPPQVRVCSVRQTIVREKRRFREDESRWRLCGSLRLVRVAERIYRRDCDQVDQLNKHFKEE